MPMNETHLFENRNQIAVKSNDLIQKSRFTLTVQQQKIVLFLISKIKPNDSEFYLYNFDIRQFCEVVGIDYDNGGNLVYLKEQIQKLCDKSIWVKLDNGKETLLRWIEKPYINEGEKTIQLKLDRDMKPYLLQLQEKFTQIQLISTLAMKSSHSIRLYEYFLSVKYKRKVRLSIRELREITNTQDKYDRYIDFKRYVLDKAIEEMYDYSDIAPFYEVIKKGKRVVAIEFEITENKFIDWYKNATKKLDEVKDKKWQEL